MIKYNIIRDVHGRILYHKVTSNKAVDELITNYIKKYNLNDSSERGRIDELKIKETAFIMAGAIISGLEYDIYTALYDEWFKDAQVKVNFYIYKYSQEFPPKLQKDESK